MPGYKGHCPTIKFDYGETYGHATAKYFQDYRSATLNSSKSPYADGGQFPTYYTHDPTLVISNRTRTRDRFLSAPKYELNNVDHDRVDELNQFDELSQAHREYYKDKSGMVGRVDAFVIPTKAEDQFKKHLPFLILSTKYKNDVQLPKLDGIVRRSQPAAKFQSMLTSRSSVRDRAMRDLHYEKR